MKRRPNRSGSVEVEPFLMDAEDLAQRLKVSKMTLWRMRDAGRLPQPVKIGALVRWRVEDIKAWLHNRCPNVDGRNSAR